MKKLNPRNVMNKPRNHRLIPIAGSSLMFTKLNTMSNNIGHNKSFAPDTAWYM